MCKHSVNDINWVANSALHSLHSKSFHLTILHQVPVSKNQEIISLSIESWSMNIIGAVRSRLSRRQGELSPVASDCGFAFATRHFINVPIMTRRNHIPRPNLSSYVFIRTCIIYRACPPILNVREGPTRRPCVWSRH